MSSLSDTVTFPTESDDWILTIIIGGVLTLFAFLLIPLFLVYGYLMEVIRDRTAGEAEPPTFEEWGQLLVDGVQAFVIGFVYMLIPIVVAGVTIGGAIVSIAAGTEAGIAAGLGGLFVGFGISFLLALIFSYVAVVALVNFAREEEFGAGFDVGVIKAVALHRDYAIAWLLSIGLFIVAGAIASILNVVPFLGTALGALVTFYVSIVAAALWADGFADAVGRQETVDHATVEESTV